MSIEEYKSYYDAYLQEQVDEYMEKRYDKATYILCWFNLYSVDTKKLRCQKDWLGKTDLKRSVYIYLLSTLLKHPEITFQELPRYIPASLYEDLLFYLLLPSTRHCMYPDSPRSRSLPIAVEMATLQQDVQAIAGDNPYALSIPSNTPEFEFEAILASIWMKKMEIDLRYTSKNNKVNVIYGMIDVDAVKEALHVKTYGGIEGALYRMWNKLSDDKSDAFWFIRWLDKHEIKYIKASEIITNDKKDKQIL